MVADPSFWVFLAFVALWGINGKKVWTVVARKLDDRAADIVQDIQEAQRLKEEAQQLLNHARRLQHEVKAHIAEIMAHKKKEITYLKKEAALALDQHLKVEEQQLEKKVELSMRQAVNEIEIKAIDLALHASKNLLAMNMDKTMNHLLFQKATDKLSQLSLAS